MIHDYTIPSDEVATIPHGDCFVNAEYSNDEPRHLRPRGSSHANGTCGGYAGLCAACWDIQLEWHKQVARAIAAKTPPKQGEDYYSYAMRVRARMVDTWPQAFSSVCS